MDIPTHAELVDKIDRFLERHGMAVTRLGREVNGDPSLVANIRDGRQPNLDTLNRLAGVMAEHDAKLPPAEDTAPQWPITSANNGEQNIGPGADSPVPFPPEAQAARPAPPPPFERRSSSTSSPTSAQPQLSLASPACSTAGEADAA